MHVKDGKDLATTEREEASGGEHCLEGGQQTQLVSVGEEHGHRGGLRGRLPEQGLLPLGA